MLQCSAADPKCGFVQDYLFSYRDKVQAVTAADVLNAAKRHLHPQQQQVVIAADANRTRAQLDKQSRAVIALDLQ